MIKRILIANRGEIAVRIIRTCREMNIETVAVYSEIDSDSLHVHLADKSVCIGKSSSKESYLNIANIVSAATLYNCDAIHPGFGFLSENPKLAHICEEIGIKFIGPRSKTIEDMGNKARARKLMEKANVPIVPGSNKIEDLNKGKEIAEEIGFPVLIKASAGGGGKGMRVAKTIEDFESNFLAAKSEAENAFGNGDVYLEKFIENPRHVEIQILSDANGNTIHLGERDCSVQRNHQKVIEESPSMIIDNETRIEMGKTAVRAAKEIGYENAGTVEFLVDKDRKFYFIEMNTRIQVEHPVTEEITGIDLIKEQIKIASGKELDISQDEIIFKGHCIEARINAEDPYNNFIPSPGEVELIYVPGGKDVRFDSFLYNGYKIPPTYDSMVGKLIVKGKNRDDAIETMKRALGELSINGIKTNVSFLFDIFNDEKFINSNYDTSFIDNFITEKGDNYVG